MASMIVWDAGLGGSGVDSATLAPVIVSTDVIWYDNVNGNDANDGLNPETSVKTVATAITKAASNAVITIAAGSNEVIAATTTVNKSVRFIAFGTGNNQGGFSFNNAGFSFSVTSDDVSFDGVYFRGLGTTASGVITCANKGLELYDCRFELSSTTSVGVTVPVSCDYCRIDGCSFTVIGAPSSGVKAVNVTGAAVALKIINTVLDGGSFGWGNASAITLAAPVRIYFKELTLAGKADITGTSPTYEIVGLTQSGATRISIT